MDDENLNELYENLADPDDEEDFEEDEIDEEEDLDDEEDNIVEDSGDDDDWWHRDEDESVEIVDVVDDESEEPDDTEYDYDEDVSDAQTVVIDDESIDYNPTTEIGSATTGKELLDAIADALEDMHEKLTFGGMRCNIQFISTSEFEALPYEDKYPSDLDDDEYEETSGDEEDEDEDEEHTIRPLSDSNTVYFIYDYEGEQ